MWDVSAELSNVFKINITLETEKPQDHAPCLPLTGMTGAAAKSWSAHSSCKNRSEIHSQLHSQQAFFLLTSDRESILKSSFTETDLYST